MATRPPSTSPSWHSHPRSALFQRWRGLLADVRVFVMLYVLSVVFVVVAVLRSLEGQSRPPDAEVERVHAADAGAWQRLGPVAFVFVLGFPDVHDDFAVAADAAAGGEFGQQPLVAWGAAVTPVNRPPPGVVTAVPD